VAAEKAAAKSDKAVESAKLAAQTLFESEAEFSDVMALIVVFLMYRFSAAMAAWLSRSARSRTASAPRPASSTWSETQLGAAKASDLSLNRAQALTPKKKNGMFNEYEAGIKVLAEQGRFKNNDEAV